MIPRTSGDLHGCSATKVMQGGRADGPRNLASAEDNHWKEPPWVSHVIISFHRWLLDAITLQSGIRFKEECVYTSCCVDGPTRYISRLAWIPWKSNLNNVWTYHTSPLSWDFRVIGSSKDTITPNWFSWYTTQLFIWDLEQVIKVGGIFAYPRAFELMSGT